MDQTTDLQAPVFLMAMPQVMDPYFQRSVVLLVDHTSEGSLGFIVNRPSQHRVSEILEGLKIPWQGDPGALAYYGGPVQPRVGTVLYSAATGSDVVAASEVFPGLSVTQHIGDLEALAGDPPQGLRLFLGYASWGKGQLLQEILRNDWLTAPVGEELVFSQNADDVWDRALRSVGVDPASLPTWTAGDGQGRAN